ncbi:hypothetical protein D9758_011606 [Tetrapyrgos nigripes]|uniref:Uncharacterized protein n=1 Tax=Tetrapyrgos nigripes TaxID=182062 RepID=A0A8H5CND5_9AGAR|nr:hypothetical protein D9758_011606 [Tetrapyrgos nigripes]
MSSSNLPGYRVTLPALDLKVTDDLNATFQSLVYDLSPLENLPNELLLEIAEHTWSGTDTKFRIVLNPGERAEPPPLHPAYHITLVSKRLRIVCLPWLFCEVEFCLQSLSYSSDEVSKLRQSLSRYAKIYSLASPPTGAFTSARRSQAGNTMDRSVNHFNYSFSNYSTRVPNSNFLDCPFADLRGRWAEQIELFHAIEHHPSDNLRVSCPPSALFSSKSDLGPELPPQDSDISLNRLLLEIDITLLVGTASDTSEIIPYNLILSLIQRGAQIVKLDFDIAPSDTGFWFTRSYNPSLSLWMRPTYTGLQELRYLNLKGLGSDPRGWLEFQDFISRHPLLQRITLRGPDIPWHSTPWTLTTSINWWLDEIPSWAQCLATVPDLFLLREVVVVRNSRCDADSDSMVQSSVGHDTWKVEEIMMCIDHGVASAMAIAAAQQGRRPGEDSDGHAHVHGMSEEERSVFVALAKALPRELKRLDIRCRHRESSLQEDTEHGRFQRIDGPSDLRIIFTAQCHLFANKRRFLQVLKTIYDTHASQS